MFSERGPTGEPNASETPKKRETPKFADFDMEYFHEIEGPDGWIALDQSNCENQRYFTVTSPEGEKLGIVGVYDTEDDKNITHTVVDPKHRGEGLAQVFKDDLMARLDLPFVTLTIDLGNGPSLRAAEKLPGVKKVSDETYEREFHKAKFIYELPDEDKGDNY